jgi:hypothetical protein
MLQYVLFVIPLYTLSIYKLLVWVSEVSLVRPKFYTQIFFGKVVQNLQRKSQWGLGNSEIE